MAQRGMRAPAACSNALMTEVTEGKRRTQRHRDAPKKGVLKDARYASTAGAEKAVFVAPVL